jgi:hypothetical protein
MWTATNDARDRSLPPPAENSFSDRSQSAQVEQHIYWISPSAAEFKEVGAEIVRALEFFKVPQREQQELMKAYNGSMADVVTETK